MIATMEEIPRKQETPLEDRIKTLRDEAYGILGQAEAYSRINEFIRNLYIARPDCANRKVYHWLKMSGPEETYIEGDFEGEWSVEAFLKSLVAEAKQEHHTK